MKLYKYRISLANTEMRIISIGWSKPAGGEPYIHLTGEETSYEIGYIRLSMTYEETERFIKTATEYLNKYKKQTK